MTPDQIGKAYDTITHLWQHQDFNRDNGIAQHKRALKLLNQHRTKDADKKPQALDIGCGCTGRFIDLLQEDGFCVEGVDVSEKMIQLARKRDPGISFYHNDICTWQPPHTYDFITAWDSIWHIPLSEQKTVLQKLIGALNPHGVLIFSFGGLDNEGEHTDSFMGPKVYYSSLGTQGFLDVFKALDCTVRHLEFDQYPEMHTYLIIQKLA